MPDGERPHLRVLDFGVVSALHSQTLWHAIAYGVSAGAPATLSFMRPSSPYVSIGYHRRLDEVDLDECARRDLPVFRRMVGGGPVYLDDGQLFFQITVPAASVPPARGRALRQLLEPAVAAFQAAGVAATLDEHLEIVAGDTKICGHGAGQIDEAVVVVGNVIERFDHEAASAVLRAPDGNDRRRLLDLMRRYVAPTPLDAVAFRTAAVSAYAQAFTLAPAAGELTQLEREQLARLDGRFVSAGWLAGPQRPTPPVWSVKVRSGVWLFDAGDSTRVRGGVVDGRLTGVEVSGVGLNGTAREIAARLEDCPLAEAGAALAPFGAQAQPVDAVLANVRGVRL